MTKKQSLNNVQIAKKTLSISQLFYIDEKNKILQPELSLHISNWSESYYTLKFLKKRVRTLYMKNVIADIKIDIIQINKKSVKN